jgi:hypothetical protein
VSWDNGKEGNYWGDYLTKYPNATEIDTSGIGNTPYVVDSNNTDHNPLMEHRSIPELPTWVILPLVTTATLIAVLFISRKRALNKFIV